MPNKRSQPLVIGQRFGKFVVLENLPHANGVRSRVRLLCDCGNTHVATTTNILQGRILSCGCTHNRRYGKQYPKLYGVLKGMIERCHNTQSYNYHLYGGRGIRVCDEWLADHETFVEWALTNGYASKLTIDRIDNNGGYSPQNCQWVTMKQNNRNRRDVIMMTAFNETKSLPEWFEDARCVVAYNTLHDRVRKGWDHELALTTPPYAKRNS